MQLKNCIKRSIAHILCAKHKRRCYFSQCWINLRHSQAFHEGFSQYKDNGLDENGGHHANPSFVSIFSYYSQPSGVTLLPIVLTNEM